MSQVIAEMVDDWNFRRGTFTGDFLPKLVPHQRQGVLDGACSFHCVSMIHDCFDACNQHDNRDCRKRLGRYLDSFQGTPLLIKGLITKQLRSVAKVFTSERLVTGRNVTADFNQAQTYGSQITQRTMPSIPRYQIEYGERQYAVTVGTGSPSIFLTNPALEIEEETLHNNALRWQRAKTFDSYDRVTTDIGSCLASYPEGFQSNPALWLPRNLI